MIDVELGRAYLVRGSDIGTAPIVAIGGNFVVDALGTRWPRKMLICVDQDHNSAVEPQQAPVASAPADPIVGAKRILSELSQVLVDRGASYGPPKQTYGRLADLLNVILGDRLKEELTATDAVLIMAAVKMGRLIQTPGHEDSWRDLAGYAALGVDVSGGDTPVK